MNLRRVSIRMGAFAVLACFVVLLSGCGASLKGRWTGSEMNPEMARDQYKFLVPAETPGKLANADVNLQKDGTFTANLIYGEKVVSVTGTWTWKGNILTMRDDKGNSYVYGVRKDGDKIAIVTPIKGTDATLHLERQD